MITITRNKQKYTGPYNWSEISLRKFIELASIPMPEGFEELILADGRYDIERQDTVESYVKIITELTDKQLDETFPEYYKKVALCLSDVPEMIMTIDLARELYQMYFMPFVVSLTYNAPVISFMGGLKEYTPDRVESFELQGQKFYLPKTITISGQSVPLAKEPIVSYSEAGDLFRDTKLVKNISKIPLFMAIYCRKKDEEYNEELVLQRQEMFMDAPMSVVWDVFFCTIKQLPSYTRCILLFGTLPIGVKEQRERVRALRSMDARV
jgi:hypothetical protein